MVLTCVVFQHAIVQGRENRAKGVTHEHWLDHAQDMYTVSLHIRPLNCAFWGHLQAQTSGRKLT